jgi:hypothetical protein
MRFRKKAQCTFKYFDFCRETESDVDFLSTITNFIQISIGILAKELDYKFDSLKSSISKTTLFEISTKN